MNSPGTWSYVYPPLLHSSWNGLTMADVIYPLFMFMMGMSMYISLKKFSFTLDKALFLKIIRRTFLILLSVHLFMVPLLFWAHCVRHLCNPILLQPLEGGFCIAGSCTHIGCVATPCIVLWNRLIAGHYGPPSLYPLSGGSHFDCILWNLVGRQWICIRPGEYSFSCG